MDIWIDFFCSTFASVSEDQHRESCDVRWLLLPGGYRRRDVKLFMTMLFQIPAIAIIHKISSVVSGMRNK